MKKNKQKIKSNITFINGEIIGISSNGQYIMTSSNNNRNDLTVWKKTKNGECEKINSYLLDIVEEAQLLYSKKRKSAIFYGKNNPSIFVFTGKTS